MSCISLHLIHVINMLEGGVWRGGKSGGEPHFMPCKPFEGMEGLGGDDFGGGFHHHNVPVIDDTGGVGGGGDQGCQFVITSIDDCE